MASPGQKCGICSYLVAIFDGHLKCTCCRDKGVGEDMWDLKKDCDICKLFTVEQKQQLATHTYKAPKECSKKTVTPTLVDPVDCKLLGRVEGDRPLLARRRKQTLKILPKLARRKPANLLNLMTWRT